MRPHALRLRELRPRFAHALRALFFPTTPTLAPGLRGVSVFSVGALGSAQDRAAPLTRGGGAFAAANAQERRLRPAGFLAKGLNALGLAAFGVTTKEDR